MMGAKELKFEHKDFEQIAQIVHKKLGIVLAAHKKNMVYRRLAKRIDDLGFSSFAQYIQHLERDDSEFSTLANAITTNLTSFFRENHHFDHLTNLLKELALKKKSIRIWSAGCSNGSEPYTIGMVVAAAIGHMKLDVKILATDIDTNMLSHGFAGIYPNEALEKIPAPFQKWTAPYGQDEFIMSDEIKAMIRFKRLNLLENWPIDKKFDIIFCRNVVIYFDKDTQRVIFNKYADLLQDHGHLYIGHSENLMSVSDRYVSLGKTIYQKTS